MTPNISNGQQFNLTRIIPQYTPILIICFQREKYLASVKFSPQRSTQVGEQCLKTASPQRLKNDRILNHNR